MKINLLYCKMYFILEFILFEKNWRKCYFIHTSKLHLSSHFIETFSFKKKVLKYFHSRVWGNKTVFILFQKTEVILFSNLVSDLVFNSAYRPRCCIHLGILWWNYEHWLVWQQTWPQRLLHWVFQTWYSPSQTSQKEQVPVIRTKKNDKTGV